MKNRIKIALEFDNPFYSVVNFFLYHPIFWELVIVKSSKLGLDYIDRVPINIFLIRHRISGKTVCHNGWGDEVSQNSIYSANRKYKLIKD